MHLLTFDTPTRIHRKLLKSAQLATLISKGDGQWPTATLGAFKISKPPAKDKMISVLTDETNDFTTDWPVGGRVTTFELSKSKMKGGHTTTNQNERAVEAAREAGLIKSSPLANELKAQGIKMAIPVAV
jgi:hypothetical protein